MAQKQINGEVPVFDHRSFNQSSFSQKSFFMQAAAVWSEFKAFTLRVTKTIHFTLNR
jgi:hypothetical protein